MTEGAKNAQVSAEPCTCVRCGYCDGNGLVRVDTDGYPEWDVESCDYCDGGIIEVCGRCELLNSMEEL